MAELYQSGFYNTGTASIAQGQTVVTGQGTAWLQAVRSADDFGKHVGRPIPIASVDSDTQITLAYPWPGPTQAAAPYRISFTPYHVAYRQALQEIGKLLASGNVSALADLEGAAGKVPLFTGPGVLDLMNILPVQDSSEDVQNGANSAYAKLLRVDGAVNAKNAFFGKYYGSSGNKNIDTLLPGETGLFSIGNPGVFPPVSLSFWFIETQRQLYNDAKHQTAYAYGQYGQPIIWYRCADTNNVYSRWVPLTPFRGSNANGNYIRFADGSQICTGRITLTGGATVTISGTWIFPARFSEAPSYVNQHSIGGPVVGARERTYWTGSTGAASASFAQSMNTAFPNPSSQDISVMAIGRWY